MLLLTAHRKNNGLTILLPIFKYHDRWKELTKKDFNFDTSSTYYQKGFDSSHELYGKENTSSPSATEMADLPH